MSSLVVRPAVHSDYQGVMDISEDVYLGLDYLPDMYFWMLHDKQNNPFVAVIDDKVVGFNNYRVINNGTTALTMATRVSSEYQGRGINETMKQQIGHELCQKYPALRHRVWTSWGNEAEDRYFQRNPEKFKNLFKWTLHKYTTTDATSLKLAMKTLRDPDGTSAISLSKAFSIQQDIKQILSEHTKHILFPISHAWVTLELTDDNLRHVIRVSDVIASITEENRLTGISFSNTMIAGPDRNSISKCFMYYGTGCQGDLQRHVKVALHRLAGILPPNIGLVGFFVHATYQDVNAKSLAAVMNEAGLKRDGTDEHGGRDDGLLTLTSIV